MQTTIKLCKLCKHPFIQKNNKHFFCSRECFLSYYHQQSKISKFPDFICPRCHKIIPLDFHPKLSTKKWINFECPNCKYRVE